jgi:peptide chain release factor subunit 1
MADADDIAAREAAIEQWKIKKLIKNLDAARGNGTSMISLIIPPKDMIARVNKMLGDEYGTASNIKSRVNRLSVLSAITSTQQRLKLYTKVPPNGLVLYCGTVLTEDGKERQVTIDFEPFKPINTSLYLCDNKFHVEALKELLESDDKFGFIIMDGNGSLFATLNGNHREILHKMSVELPKKHGRGGQSALRFARLRLEKRHNYVTKVAEMAAQVFITNDKVNVVGLIVAGSAEFKTVLVEAERFDQRLAAKVIGVYDVSYGGENGLNQAIEQSAEILSNVKFVQEKKVIKKYFDEIAQDTGKICFGLEDTMRCLEAGAIEMLMVWENLDTWRLELRNPVTGDEETLNLAPAELSNPKHFKDEENSCDKEVTDKIELVEWLSTNYTKFGCKLEIVSNKSQEGSQFCKGFGGVGGFLRYRCDFLETDVFEGMEDGSPVPSSDSDFDDDLDIDDFM